MAPTDQGGRNDALDGLRLLAVAAVMAFHFGLPYASGGFLGVDVFFVLSGFLITSLLLETARSGPCRRDRLLDAASATVNPCAARTRGGRCFVGRQSSPRRVSVTVCEATSPRACSTSRTGISSRRARTSPATASPSPLQHIWSLAVEEQFYLVWPLVLVRDGADRETSHGVASSRWEQSQRSGSACPSAIRLAMLWADQSDDRAYLGTDSRMFEPLAGALLAVLLCSTSVRAARRSRALGSCSLSGRSVFAGALAALGGPGGATSAYAHGGAVVVAVERSRASSRPSQRAAARRRVRWRWLRSPISVDCPTRCISGTGLSRCGRAATAGGT